MSCRGELKDRYRGVGPGPVIGAGRGDVPGGAAMAVSRLEDRVERAAEAALTAQGYVSPVDVLLGLGWLAPSLLDEWRQGRVEYLERVVQAGLGKQTTAMRTLRAWA